MYGQELRTAYETCCNERREPLVLSAPGFAETLRLRGCIPAWRKVEGKAVRAWNGIEPTL